MCRAGGRGGWRAWGKVGWCNMVDCRRRRRDYDGMCQWGHVHDPPLGSMYQMPCSFILNRPLSSPRSSLSSST